MPERRFEDRNGERIVRTAGTCKGCGEEIWWVRKAGGGWLPENEDGQNHFATCPKRDIFKRPVQGSLIK
jgi:hypothetical protein